ncbi:MAG: hypothetical protein P9M08_08355 [Candidatus Erginobacter occultus]|nr:hypothetical protein [Candidatus Erginobacter occultus]
MKKIFRIVGKFLAVFGVVLVGLAMLELTVRVYLNFHPLTEVEVEREELFIPLHPYFGHQDESPFMPERIEKKSESEYTVLLLGGSTAMTIPWTLQTHLNQKNPFPEISRFRVILAAHHGFLTVQDKNLLVAFLSNGSEIDLVICVEGFNNLVRPLENYAYQLPLNYPGWYWVAGNRMEYGSPGAYHLALFLDGLKNHQPARSWKSLQLGLNGLVQLLAKQFHTRGIEVIGEKITAISTEEKLLVWEKALDLYRRDILFMNMAARCRGIDIIFVLHAMLGYARDNPTEFEEQFLRTSPMYDLQLIPYSLWSQGYDGLRETGAKLQENGVDYLDLSPIFKSAEYNPYIDLVHMNQEGSDAFGEKLAEAVLERIKKDRTSR